jgi:hydroxyethylthiazole kinase-like uncharacterized protein yjeF
MNLFFQVALGRKSAVSRQVHHFVLLKLMAKIIGAFNPKAFKPTREDNKYSRGVVAVAMSKDFPGAALTAAHAAQAVGAGYVKVFCPKEHLTICQVQHPDLVFISYESFEHLSELLESERLDSLVIGSGWKSWPDSLQWVMGQPTVLDGGFLYEGTLKKVGGVSQEHVVLTPHQGELKKLLGGETLDTFLSTFKGTLLIKGYETDVYTKDEVRKTDWNSPSLSTAGSGDVLAGLIARCLLLKVSVAEACAFAVDIHRQAAQNLPTSCPPSALIASVQDLINRAGEHGSH